MYSASAHPFPRAARPKPRGRKAWLSGPGFPPAAMFAVTIALIVAHQGKLLELTFTPMAIIVAYVLLRRYPVHYLSYVCWLFFLTPEVRRLADFFKGAFNPTSVIMVAPLAAAGMCGFSMVLNYRKLGERRMMPLILMFIAVMYAYVLGIVEYGVGPATFTLVIWVVPIFTGAHVIFHWKEYHVYRRVLLKTFVYGALVMGLYGVYQYVSPPPWVAFWMLESGMGTSGGQAVPFSMRVCSTMNSTGPFALAIMSCLLMLVPTPGKLKVVAGVAGLAALAFTAVRSGWGGLIVGLIYPLAMLDSRSRMKLIVTVVALAGLFTPVLMVDQLSGPLVMRFESISNLQDDNSFQQRSGIYAGLANMAEDSFAGHGLGSTGMAAKLTTDGQSTMQIVDSGILDLTWVLGWPGTLLYVTGILMMVWRAFVASRALPTDRFAISAVGVAIAILANLIMVDTLQGLSGMFFMLGALMPTLGVRYARESQRTARNKRAAGGGETV
jgi:hypothetical protein